MWLLRRGYSTHFGYRQVPIEEKTTLGSLCDFFLVAEVFKRVAGRYDIMNDVMSMGLHRCWKTRLASILNPHPSMTLLDVAGGTGIFLSLRIGDIAFRFMDVFRAKHGKDHGLPQVTVVDINPAMLKVGQHRATSEYPSIIWREGDAEKLVDIPSDSFDAYSIAFGIRNCTNIQNVLNEAYRVLRPGGLIAVLEFSPQLDTPKFLQKAYDLYSAIGIPLLGQIISGHRDPYQYLVESIRKFPTKDRFAAMVSEAGFSHVQVEPLSAGICAIHTGIKLPSKE